MERQKSRKARVGHPTARGEGIGPTRRAVALCDTRAVGAGIAPRTKAFAPA
jgi:hypothetical protein